MGKKKVGQLPLGTYEEWLGRQLVKPAPVKPEVEMPADSIEVWIDKRVKKILQSND